MAGKNSDGMYKHTDFINQQTRPSTQLKSEWWILKIRTDSHLHKRIGS